MIPSKAALDFVETVTHNNLTVLKLVGSSGDKQVMLRLGETVTPKKSDRSEA